MEQSEYQTTSEYLVKVRGKFPLISAATRMGPARHPPAALIGVASPWPLAKYAILCSQQSREGSNAFVHEVWRRANIMIRPDGSGRTCSPHK